MKGSDNPWITIMQEGEFPLIMKKCKIYFGLYLGIYSILCLLLTGAMNIATGQTYPPERILFLEPEIMIGRNIPIYDKFPESGIRSNYVLNLGIQTLDTGKHWVKYYNFPTTGISFSYSNLGNREVLRNEFSLIPFIVLKTSRNPRKSIDFKIGLGASYFNHPYHEVYNPENKVIGSQFTWAFQFFLYKNLYVSNRMNLKLGGGFLHSSNAHTTIPNYGMNSVMVSLALQMANKPYDPDFTRQFDKLPLRRRNHYFIQARLGYGWHELGGTWEPVGTKDYRINSYSISGGVIKKRHLRLSLGFTYRFYESFYDFIRNNKSRTGLGENPKSEASNVIIHIGTEFLIGHLGMDIQLGYNLHKPFYDEFNSRWEFNNGFKYWRNKYLVTRFGMKLYLISNEKMPRHNVYLGSHINANFGKADFMDLSLGYTFLLK